MTQWEPFKRVIKTKLYSVILPQDDGSLAVIDAKLTKSKAQKIADKYKGAQVVKITAIN